MSVIMSRAIPEIDGFKPSHRKLLYTMYKMGLLTGPRIKSANIVGSAMQLTAVYACVRIISESIAGLPIHVYQYTDSGSKEKAITDYLTPSKIKTIKTKIPRNQKA